MPNKWISFVKDIKRLVPEFKNEGQLVEHVCKVLQTHKPLRSVKFDDNANKACRKNNAEVVAKNEEVPELGGNVSVYQSLVEGKSTHSLSEYTVFNWQESCTHLIAY